MKSKFKKMLKDHSTKWEVNVTSFKKIQRMGETLEKKIKTKRKPNILLDKMKQWTLIIRIKV